MNNSVNTSKACSEVLWKTHTAGGYSCTHCLEFVFQCPWIQGREKRREDAKRRFLEEMSKFRQSHFFNNRTQEQGVILCTSCDMGRVEELKCREVNDVKATSLVVKDQVIFESGSGV